MKHMKEVKSNDKNNHRKTDMVNCICIYVRRSNNANNNVLSVANNSISNLPKGVLVDETIKFM